MEWYEDPVQGLTEHIVQAIIDLTIGRIEYEGVIVRQGRPKFQDTDIPLSQPIISIEAITITPVPTNFSDQLAEDLQGMDLQAQFALSVWTSRGLPHTPASGSGGINTANRILGLLINDISLDLTYVPDGVQTWNLVEAPSGSLEGIAEYDEKRDLYEAQALLFVESEVWRRSGQDGCS